MGCCNLPQYLRKQLYPKLVHLALRVLIVSDPVPIELEDFGVRDGWILENSINRQGGTEVKTLPVQPLLFCIPISAHSDGFLCSVDIMQGSSSGGGGGYLLTRELFGIHNVVTKLMRATNLPRLFCLFFGSGFLSHCLGLICL